MLILLVEDSAITAMALARQLAARGHRVLGPFASAPDALQCLEGETPDVAILDVQVRGGSSLPVAHWLHERGIPFCFLTGFSEVPELLEVRRFNKPIATAELIAYLESTVR